MTLNQRRAMEFLEVYRKASEHCRFLHERCEVQRAKVERMTGIPVAEGWTGKFEGYGPQGKEITSDPKRLKKPKKVFAPIARSKAQNKTQEILLTALMDLEADYERALEELSGQAEQISRVIDTAVESPYSAVLKYMYITKYGYKETAAVMGYSWQHIKRLHWEALEFFGAFLENLHPNEPK